jgi:hypothetical protein
LPVYLLPCCLEQAEQTWQMLQPCLPHKPDTPPGASELQNPTPGAAKTLSSIVSAQGLYSGWPLDASQPLKSCTRAKPRCPAANAASSPAVKSACCRSDLMGSPGAVPSRLYAHPSQHTVGSKAAASGDVCVGTRAKHWRWLARDGHVGTGRGVCVDPRPLPVCLLVLLCCLQTCCSHPLLCAQCLLPRQLTRKQHLLAPLLPSCLVSQPPGRWLMLRALVLHTGSQCH